MRSSRSFDWSKCQCLFALSAINVVWGLWVVTGEYDWSFPNPWRANSLPVWAKERFAYRLNLYFFCSRKRRKKMECSFILCSSMLFEENILLSLVWLYGMLYFKCGGWAEAQCRYGWVSVGFWYTSVLMLPIEFFITLVSRKFTEMQEILCVNLISGTTPLRYSINKCYKRVFASFSKLKIYHQWRTQSII